MFKSLSYHNSAKSNRSVDSPTIFIRKMQDFPHSPLSTHDIPNKYYNVLYIDTTTWRGLMCYSTSSVPVI